MGLGKATESGRNGAGSGERYVIWWKPFWITFGLGPLGLFALFGQIWLSKINSLIGNPFGGYVPLARLCLTLLGLFLLFIAWPIWRPAGLDPDQEEPED
jgi:hypothetical protein